MYMYFYFYLKQIADDLTEKKMFSVSMLLLVLMMVKNVCLIRNVR